jgi:hypothetical protein
MFNFSDYVNDDADDEEMMRKMETLAVEGKTLMCVNRRPDGRNVATSYKHVTSILYKQQQ